MNALPVDGLKHDIVGQQPKSECPGKFSFDFIL